MSRRVLLRLASQHDAVLRWGLIWHREMNATTVQAEREGVSVFFPPRRLSHRLLARSLVRPSGSCLPTFLLFVYFFPIFRSILPLSSRLLSSFIFFLSQPAHCLWDMRSGEGEEIIERTGRKERKKERTVALPWQSRRLRVRAPQASSFLPSFFVCRSVSPPHSLTPPSPGG